MNLKARLSTLALTPVLVVMLLAVACYVAIVWLAMGPVNLVSPGTAMRMLEHGSAALRKLGGV